MRAICVALSFVALATVARGDELTTLDGQKLAGEVSAIDEAGVISGANLPADLKLDALRRIDRAVADATVKGAVVLDLVGGGRIQGEAVTVEKEKFHVVWSLGEKLVLPIEAVRAVRFKPAASDDSFEAAVAKPSADHDRLFVEIDGKLAILTGLIESLTTDEVSFQYEGKQQTLPTAKLFGIVVAQVAQANKSGGTAIELADGSRLAGVIKALAEGKVSLAVGTATVSLPWQSVKSVTIRSSRLAFLSDLDPVEVDEHRLVTLPAAWQRDKNVAKKSLTLGDRTYDRGIGTHAYSKLVFDIEGQYDVFSAVIGIDAAADRKGDCVFVVLGDEKELARERMTGATEAKELKLDVSGVKQLTLIVEPGEELDLADLADWADARVIKTK